MKAADALDSPHGAAFQEKLEDLFDPRHFDVGTLDAICGLCAEGLLALHAAKALATVSVRFRTVALQLCKWGRS